MPGNTKRATRGRLARAVRTARATGAPSDLRAVEDLRRDYYAEALRDYITAVVAKAPPLTDAQVAGLRSLLAEASGRRG